MNILIAEDNKDTREEIAEMLEEAEGIDDVFQAKDGNEAFQKIQDENVDLVISDIKMPEMTGYELLGNVKKEVQKEIPFILLTGSSIDEGVFVALNAVGIECIKKPPDYKYLMTKIKEKVKDIHTKNELARIGAVKEELTILFADIEGYTKLSKKLLPAEVVVIINDCLKMMSTIATEHNGTVDKFIGDEMMVVYDPPRAKNYGIEEAIDTALEIKKEISRYNRKKETSLSLNIGICQDEVFSCSLGNSRYKELTVIGDAVNIASRLCAGAKKGQILIDKNTFENVKKLPKINRKTYKEKTVTKVEVKNTEFWYYEIVKRKA